MLNELNVLQLLRRQALSGGHGYQPEFCGDAKKNDSGGQLVSLEVVISQRTCEQELYSEFISYL